MKIVLFNGSPGSGKDTFGSLLIEELNTAEYTLAEHYSFKEIMFDILCGLFSISRIEWFDRYQTKKEEPWDKLRGMSQREALIALSEKGLKNAFGNDIFGMHMKNRVKSAVDMAEEYEYFTVFTDGGFQEELDPLKEEFGADNIMIVRLHREGHDFSNDSRSLLEDSEVHSIDVKSEGIGETFDIINEEVKKWAN